MTIEGGREGWKNGRMEGRKKSGDWILISPQRLPPWEREAVGK
jgi:hypothetical protein